MTPQRLIDGGHAATDAQHRVVLGGRGVGVLLDEFPQPFGNAHVKYLLGIGMSDRCGVNRKPDGRRDILLRQGQADLAVIKKCQFHLKFSKLDQRSIDASTSGFEASA